ncbi:MAG: phage major capsid protein [Chloroflexi bacterium]|nr:phage major capsid protein [Chloroflexota bacterium]
MPSTALTEADAALAAARKEAREFLEAHPNPADWTADDKASSKTHETKMADLHDKLAELQQAEHLAELAKEPERKSDGRVINDGDPSQLAAATKGVDISELLRANESYMDIVGRKSQVSGRKSWSLPLFEIPSFKALIALTDINNPPTRLPGLRPSIQDETTVADLMLPGTTDNNTITYIEETTFTNAATSVAEGAAKPESALDFTERTDNVRKIATWIPATDELLADVAGFRSYLEGRLRFMVEREEEDQLLNGDGTAPNISGILDRTGVQTIGSAGTDVDAIYNAITEVRVDGQAEPTGVVVHPLSWQNLRLAKDNNDAYYGPGPFANTDVERIWGLPVRVTPMIAEGTALVGAFRPHAQVFRREGITVTASTEHASFFVENKVAVLAETRLALAVYRPAAFCSVTGLASS